MPGITLEEFERLAKRRVEIWAKDMAVPLGKIAKLNEEIAKLESKKTGLTPEEKTRLESCRAARDKLQKEVESLTGDLERDLLLIKPLEKATKSDLDLLTDKIKDLIKKFEKGLPLGGGWSIKPDVKFDIKKLKPEKIGLILEWRF